MKNNVADKSGLGNHGSLVMGTTGNIATSSMQKAGKIGQALSFDGVSDYVNCGSNSSVLPDAFSYSVWLKSNSSATQAILGFGSTDYPSILLNYVNNIYLFLGGSNYRGFSRTSPTNTTDNKWHHYTFIVPGNGQNDIDNSVLYVDGRVQNVVTTLNTNVQNSKVLCKLGRYATASSLYSYSGLMDDVRIYNRALSASEIQQLYNQGAANKISDSPQVATTTCTTGLSCGLVGYWTFDGPDMKNNVADKSGLGNHGSLVMGTTGNSATSSMQKPGKIGQALSFDGVSDGVIVNDSDSLDIPDSGDITMAAWVYYEDFTSNPVVFEKMNNYKLHIGTDRKIQGQKNISNGFPQNSYPNNARMDSIATQALTAKRWYHIVVTVSGTNYPIIYVNGAFAAVNNYLTATTYDLSQNIGIGRRPNSVSQLVNGKYDDMRIYNRALSATEIQALYNQGAANKISDSPQVATTTCTTGLSCGLVGYWTFDGPDMKNNVADKSGLGNHGSLVMGTTGNTATSSMQKPGKIGQALSFDGVSDYVDTPDNDSLDVSTVVTFSFWGKRSLEVNQVGIIEKRSGTNTDMAYSIRDSSGSEIWAQFSSDGSSFESEASIRDCGFRDSNWTYITVTFNNGSIIYYRNGIQCDTDTSAQTPIHNSARNLWLGKNSVGIPGFFSGSLDDVRIYNRALSADEIRQLYNLGR